MTLSTVDIEEIRKHLESPHENGEVLKLSFTPTTQETTPSPLTGKELVKRLENLLAPEEVDLLERHINESCEQEND